MQTEKIGMQRLHVMILLMLQIVSVTVQMCLHRNIVRALTFFSTENLPPISLNSPDQKAGSISSSPNSHIFSRFSFTSYTSHVSLFLSHISISLPHLAVRVCTRRFLMLSESEPFSRNCPLARTSSTWLYSAHFLTPLLSTGSLGADRCADPLTVSLLGLLAKLGLL